MDKIILIAGLSIIFGLMLFIKEYFLGNKIEEYVQKIIDFLDEEYNIIFGFLYENEKINEQEYNYLFALCTKYKKLTINLLYLNSSSRKQVKKILKIKKDEELFEKLIEKWNNQFNELVKKAEGKVFDNRLFEEHLKETD
jgi:hypothetical protein